MRIANFTDFRANLKGYMDSIIDDSDTLVINRDNGTGIVMMSLDEYNAIKETGYLISSPETMAAIRHGEEEIRTGKCFSQKDGESIDEFLNRIACTE